MCEAEREHLQRIAAALPPEEHTPELRQLLRCYEDGAAAAELLRGVDERVEAGSSLRELLQEEDAALFRVSLPKHCAGRTPKRFQRLLQGASP